MGDVVPGSPRPWLISTARFKAIDTLHRRARFDAPQDELGRFGAYTLQAAIAAVHAEAESVAATDWRQIVALYDRLVRIQPSPVVQLNRAVAIAMCDGPEAGLTHIDAVLEHGELANYYLAHSARADMYRRLGRTAEARASYEKALALTQQEPERQFLRMRIYIDEAGPFLPPQPPRSLFSLVLSLIIPSSIEQELFYELLRLRDTWPNQSVEIKGSSLNESQAVQLISLVLKYDTLVQFIALDANTHPDTLVEDFKKRQADGVTANITREHHPGPIPHLHQLGEAVRRMSNQLFLQSFATWELIIRTIREGTVYFVQRQPEELGDIAWVIDRKDQTLTQMEETWSTLILPLSESAFANEPLIGILEEDYSYFDARYGFNRATIDPDELRHLQWLRSVSGKGILGEDKRLGVNAKLLLTEQRTFEDSRDSLGLQLADMLAATLRRALNDQLQYPGWKDFGGLLVRHHNPGTGFIQLGAGAETPMLGHARRVCKILDSRAKSMVAE